MDFLYRYSYWVAGLIGSGIGEAMREIIAMVLIGCVAAIMVHVSIGAWLKWRYCFCRDAKRSVWPVIGTHLLFGLCFVNPYFLLWLDSLVPEYGRLVDVLRDVTVLWLLGMIMDLLLLNLLPRLKVFNGLAQGSFRLCWVWMPLLNALIIDLVIGVVVFIQIS